MKVLSIGLMGIVAAWASAAMSGGRQTDMPNPNAYLRAEDRQRARLLTTPCSHSDLERGCYRERNGFLVREAPCSYHIDATTNGSIPIDQCYKMDRPQRFRGIWIDGFEGQQFIPEGTKAPEWPSGDLKSSGVRARFDRARVTTIWLDVDRAGIGHDFRNGGRRMAIDFIGRQTMYPGWYGHMGMSGREIIVDRVISLKPIE